MTTLRTDMVLGSEIARPVVLLEQTVSWVDWMKEMYETKRAKNEDLIGECQRQGWLSQCAPIEVGCRGQSLCMALKLTQRPQRLQRGPHYGC